MPDIKIYVKNKIATKTDDTIYVCDNSDFRAVFDFDAEWDEYEAKTARFSYNGIYTDVVFSGNVCTVPIISDTFCFYVGVFAGDLHTTTPARVPCRKSILFGGGVPAAPADDVYSQIIGICNETAKVAESVREDADAGKFDGKDGKTPVKGIDYFTDAEINAIVNETAKAVFDSVKNAEEVAV